MTYRGVVLPEGTVVEVTLVPDEPVISSPKQSLDALSEDVV